MHFSECQIEPIRELRKPAPIIFNQIVKELTGENTPKNALLGPFLIKKALRLTHFENPQEAAFKAQVMLAGAIIIQVFDQKVESGKEYSTKVVHEQVLTQLAKKGFDHRVINRVRTQGISKLEEMRSAMEQEKSAYSHQPSFYEHVATLSNGAQYTAALFQDTETDTPSYVHQINWALRLLLDTASVAKDYSKDEPNVLLGRIRHSPLTPIQEIIDELNKDVDYVSETIFQDLERDATDPLKVYYFNLLLVAQKLFDSPIARMYVARQIKTLSSAIL